MIDSSRSPVVGWWSLLEWRTVDASGATIGHPFGVRAAGTLGYSAGGFMQGQVSAQDRPRPASADPFGGSDLDRAAAYSSYVAYSGRYDVHPDRIVHHVNTSLFPGWTGSEQVRYYTLTGDELSLRTPPIEVAGAVVVNELRWRRVEG